LSVYNYTSVILTQIVDDSPAVFFETTVH